MAAGGLAEVTAPRTGVPTSWTDKINDVRDRIRQNGSYNAPPPESGTAVNDMALYHPSIQSAAQQRSILDPSDFQYGLVSGPKVGIRRPVGSEPAASLRDLALSDHRCCAFAAMFRLILRLARFRGCCPSTKCSRPREIRTSWSTVLATTRHT